MMPQQWKLNKNNFQVGFPVWWMTNAQRKLSKKNTKHPTPTHSFNMSRQPICSHQQDTMFGYVVHVTFLMQVKQIISSEFLLKICAKLDGHQPCMVSRFDDGTGIMFLSLNHWLYSNHTIKSHIQKTHHQWPPTMILSEKSTWQRRVLAKISANPGITHCEETTEMWSDITVTSRLHTRISSTKFIFCILRACLWCVGANPQVRLLQYIVIDLNLNLCAPAHCGAVYAIRFLNRFVMYALLHKQWNSWCIQWDYTLVMSPLQGTFIWFETRKSSVQLGEAQNVGLSNVVLWLNQSAKKCTWLRLESKLTVTNGVRTVLCVDQTAEKVIWNRDLHFRQKYHFPAQRHVCFILGALISNSTQCHYSLAYTVSQGIVSYRS